MWVYVVYCGINLLIGFIFIAIGYRLYYHAAFKNTKQTRTQVIKILPGTCFSAFGMVAIGVGLWTFFPKVLPPPESPELEKPAAAVGQTQASPPKPQEVVLTLAGPLVVRQEPCPETYAPVDRTASIGHSPIVTLKPPEPTFAPSGLSPIPGRER
ncbi:MAG TPA: hypothetical protein VMY42_11980 [Thermoguttaceae bacterium]|nr:hypothetical protein [Thermoguttaceae bacterium]